MCQKITLNKWKFTAFRIISNNRYELWSSSLLSLIVVISPLISVAAGIGLVYGLDIIIHKFEKNTMLTIAPFLILAIGWVWKVLKIFQLEIIFQFASGVDDAFLLINGWYSIVPRTENIKSENFPQTFGILFATVCPSVTITSLTNALAFGIGGFSIKNWWLLKYAKELKFYI